MSHGLHHKVGLSLLLHLSLSHTFLTNLRAPRLLVSTHSHAHTLTQGHKRMGAERKAHLAGLAKSMYCEAFEHASDQAGTTHVKTARRFHNHDQNSYLTHHSANNLTAGQAHSRREKLKAQREAMMHHKGERGSMSKRSARARAEVAGEYEATYGVEEETLELGGDAEVMKVKKTVQRRKYYKHLAKHGHSTSHGNVRLHESTGGHVDADYLDGSRMTAGGKQYQTRRIAHRGEHGAGRGAGAGRGDAAYEIHDEEAAPQDEESGEESEYEEVEEEVEYEEEVEVTDSDDDAPPPADDTDSDDAPPPADDSESDDAPPPPADDDSDY